MNILEVIEGKKIDLSRKQQMIAQFVIDNKNSVGFMSLKEMSSEIGVSEVTILNFCKSIGVDSFTQLKKDFQNTIMERLHIPNEIRSSLDELISNQEAYENSINMHRDNTEQTIKANNLENIDQAAELIKNARRILICGLGFSKIIADYLNARIRLLSLDARVLEIGDIISTSMELGTVTQEDCFILVAFPVYSQSIVGFSRFLHKRKLKFISITDTGESPIAIHASSVLLCNSKALVFQNSISTPLFLAEILLDTLSYKMKDQLLISLDELEEVRKALSVELLNE